MRNYDLCRTFAAGAVSGTGSHLFIEGDSLYSYGHHFVVARRNADGSFWLNPAKYSPTTSRHQSYARRAIEAAGRGNNNLKQQFDL
jgi:hypothetical protein